ncbi:DnaJ domain-containing protein [Leptothermofonsia sp. ETS-13]|uniref:J domain-containing protein n=1 Tax=Leptothermofonsia sp. ETS-13 TaxID=3035696 RepID=UPI003B9FF4EF
MNLATCYQLLGLPSGASFDDIKASYRRLARKYHPDVNPGDERAREKFMAVTEAYKYLLSVKVSSEFSGKVNQLTVARKPTPDSAAPSRDAGNFVKAAVSPKPASLQFNPDLSPLEQQLKASSYQQLQRLLKQHRFPRAIALIEGLARRIPQDPEVIQWQAIIYQRWGRHLIQERQLDKARIYLKKALRTDPHNRSLWAEVEKDFRYMEQLF